MRKFKSHNYYPQGFGESLNISDAIVKLLYLGFSKKED